MNQSDLHSTLYPPKITDVNLPICIYRNEVNEPKVLFRNHWHEQLEFIYFVRGNAVVQCNSNKFNVGPQDIIVINSNELHYAESLGCDLQYYIVIVDIAFLRSSCMDVVQTRYINPMMQNYIVFDNQILNSPFVIECLEGIITEYQSKLTGFELALKYHLYHLLVLLLRNHVQKVMTEDDYNNILQKLNRFYPIVKYIEDNFTDEISLNNLSGLLNVSEAHFCRSFKEFIGKTPKEYINLVRVNKASDFLRECNMSITEVAFQTGFNDISYFSRVFKSYKKMSPTLFRTLAKK